MGFDCGSHDFYPLRFRDDGHGIWMGFFFFGGWDVEYGIVNMRYKYNVLVIQSQINIFSQGL